MSDTPADLIAAIEDLPELPDRLAYGNRNPSAARRAAREWREAATVREELLQRVHEHLGGLPDEDEAPTVLRNCWTCAHNEYDGTDSVCVARAYPFDWLKAQTLDEIDMPPKTADGCPKWASKDDA